MITLNCFPFSMIALFRKLRKEKMHRSNSSQLLSSKVIWGLSAYFLLNLEHPSYFCTFSQMAPDDQEGGMGDSSKDKLLDIEFSFKMAAWKKIGRNKCFFFSYTQDPSDLWVNLYSIDNWEHVVKAIVHHSHCNAFSDPPIHKILESIHDSCDLFSDPAI